MKTLIKNGHLVNPKTALNSPMDILIQDGKIIQVEPRGTIGAILDLEQEIDASGLYVFPGFIDLHVHLREPGFEHKETIKTGTMACAKGGYTTVACMPNTSPALDSTETLKTLYEIIQRDAIIDVLPVGAITKSIAGEKLTNHTALLDLGVVGLSDDGRTTMNSDFMIAAFESSKLYGRPVMTHSEDHVLTSNYKDTVFPIQSETTIVLRDIDLCQKTNGHLHVGHISGKDAIEAVRKAKKGGVHVTCEVTPHHFALTDEQVDVLNPQSKVNPPIREEGHRRAVIDGIKDGTIDIIATDHAPHDEDSKKMPYEKAAYGISGIETAFSVAYHTLVLEEEIDLVKVIAMMTSIPARLANLKNVGSIESGYNANVTLVELSKKVTIDRMAFVSKGKNTPFHGRTYTGEVMMTLFNGNIVYKK